MMIGKKFGKLTVIEELNTRSKNGHKQYKCQCDCGNIKIVRGDTLKNGMSQSCGCTIGIMHGLTATKLYKVYNGMKNRCCNKNASNYEYYGGRGIKVCNEWVDNFKNFYDWAINNDYHEGLSIDRIDTNGDYEPNNCKWKTSKQQCNNKRNNVHLTYNGKTQTLSQWAEELGTNYNTMASRYYRGWEVEDILYGKNNIK